MEYPVQMRNLDRPIEELCEATKLLMEKSTAGTVADLASAVEKATGVLKVCVDLQKPRVFDRIVALAPFLTVWAVSAGVFVTYYQFTVTERNKLAAALETEWQDAFKSVYASRTLSPGVFPLRKFFDSPKYGPIAKDAIDYVLANSTDIPLFANVFPDTFKSVGPEDIDGILKINRTLGARAVPVWDRTPRNKETLGDEPERLSPPDKEVYYFGRYAFPQITAKVGVYLRTAYRPTLDLSYTVFNNGDWQNSDLGRANLSYCRLGYIDPKGANLGEITDFHEARADGTAWWRAKNINPKFLAYLREKYGFIPDQQYGPQYEKSTPAEYKLQLDRLIKQAH